MFLGGRGGSAGAWIANRATSPLLLPFKTHSSSWGPRYRARRASARAGRIHGSVRGWEDVSFLLQRRRVPSAGKTCPRPGQPLPPKKKGEEKSCHLWSPTAAAWAPAAPAQARSPSHPPGGKERARASFSALRGPSCCDFLPSSKERNKSERLIAEAAARQKGPWSR